MNDYEISFQTYHPVLKYLLLISSVLFLISYPIVIIHESEMFLELGLIGIFIILVITLPIYGIIFAFKYKVVFKGEFIYISGYSLITRKYKRSDLSSRVATYFTGYGSYVALFFDKNNKTLFKARYTIYKGTGSDFTKFLISEGFDITETGYKMPWTKLE